MIYIEPFSLIDPIYKRKIWGSNELVNMYYNININEKENIGEVWNFSPNESETNLCINEIRHKQILIKTLFVDGSLSLQVHPDEKMAQRLENSHGKNEIWYVLYADNNTYAIIGTKDKIKKDKIKELINSKNLNEELNIVRIKKNDIIEIPAGMIHSITGKAILYEVQQNCNITYRLYDRYNRNLNIEKSLKAIKYKRSRIKNKESGRLIKNKYFQLQRINVCDEKIIKNNSGQVMTVIKGEGFLVYKNKKIKIYKGITIFIPQRIKKYSILGDIEVLITN